MGIPCMTISLGNIHNSTNQPKRNNIKKEIIIGEEEFLVLCLIYKRFVRHALETNALLQICQLDFFPNFSWILCFTIITKNCQAVLDKSKFQFKKKDSFVHIILIFCITALIIFLDQGKNLKLRISSYFHISFSGISSPCVENSNPAGYSLTF